ncbi:pyrroline-5-carboxylate reductase [uncultured Enterovirga sp.]|uniref:pyrroline-5-carboxylate reductase n=1 Tax=uncultured Enterovirga sp. TaxID=2026352 RepID=UPI0035CA358C
MGGAMLEGWLARGLDPAAVTILDPNASADLAARGLRVAPEAGDLTIAPPAILVLATKPQSLDAVAPGIASVAGPDTLVVSILAGKTMADLRRALPDARAIVRAMPNLPASIGRGATGAYANEATSERQRREADALLSANGMVEWVGSEDLIDAVTALSGSGPAYIFHLAEAMAEAGAAAGLEPALAARLARATVVGAAALLGESPLEPAQLRQNVTSQGGTTAAALDVLMAEDGLRPLMREAVAAAKRRAAELSG